MALELVIDAQDSQFKGGLFEEDRLVQTVLKKDLNALIKTRKPSNTLISTAIPEIISLLEEKKLPFKIVDHSKLKILLDIDDPKTVTDTQIFNAYGALKHFPVNDSIVVNMGSGITVDLIGKDGRYSGGMNYPSQMTNVKPTSGLGKTADTRLQGGIYYGLLGAIERLVDELRQTVDSPSSVKVIAANFNETGDFIEDLKELVDCIDPHLALVGLHEIQKEFK
jgi:pantothenate kinase type III